MYGVASFRQRFWPAQKPEVERTFDYIPYTAVVVRHPRRSAERYSVTRTTVPTCVKANGLSRHSCLRSRCAAVSAQTANAMVISSNGVLVY